MQHMKPLAYSGIATLALLSAAAFAHHSYTRFDMANTMTLEGTIKEFQWTNPHVWIQLVVKDPATGKEVEWGLESDSPNMLSRRGWSRKSMKQGDTAVAVIHPLKIRSEKMEGALESLKINGELIGAAKP